MSFLRRIFGRGKSNSNTKPSVPDYPTNKYLKKILFYGFLFFTTATIISKKYKTKLIFTFDPNEQNLKIIDSNTVFHQGVYNPVYYMFASPMQRFYAKYFQEAPYFRASQQPASKQRFQITDLPVHDKHSKVFLFQQKSQKQNIPILILISGCEGLDNGLKKMMLSMNNNGFKSICINPDDFHSIKRLQNTISYIKVKNPNSKIYGLGVDYGANLLVNYAAENQSTFNGIVSLANPLNLQQSQQKIQNSNFLWKRLLYQDILKGRIKKCQNYKQMLGQNLKISPQSTTLYQLDKSCYSQSYEDYKILKQRLSSINSIKKLKVHSLFIQSQQDPFSISIQQNQEKLQNQKCIFVQSQRGGHQEWFQSMKALRWVNRPIVQFLKYVDGRYGSIYGSSCDNRKV